MMKSIISPKRSSGNLPRELIEKIERTASFDDYDPREHYDGLERQCTESAASLRALIASTYGDEAEDVTERIVARYNDEIPDDEGMGMAGSIRTLQAIVDFYGKVTAEIRTAAAVPTVETPTRNMYDVARTVVKAKQCWTSGERVDIGKVGRATVYLAQSRPNQINLSVENGSPGPEVRAARLMLGHGDFWQFKLTKDEYEGWVVKAREMV